MTRSIVDEDMLLAGRMPVKRALAPFDHALERSNRHDAFDVRAAVGDPDKISVDLDNWRFVDKRREPTLHSHVQLHRSLSRVAHFSITCVKIKPDSALNLSNLAVVSRSWLISTGRPRFGTPIAKAVSPIMGAPLIHNPPEHLPPCREDRHV